MICENFTEDDNCYRHKCEQEDEPTYTMMFYNSSDESCGVRATIDELAYIFMDPVVMDTFMFVGESADVLSSEAFVDKLNALIKENRTKINFKG